MKTRAFTLVEVITVVCILGILAAIVVPQLQGHIIQARESSAKDTLHIVRTQISLYKMQHNGLAPGYMGGSQASLPMLTNQLIGTSRVDGFAVASKIPSGAYIYGPYLNKMPINPFNSLSDIDYVPVATAFAAAVDGTSGGWLYKKETAEIRLNWTGADSDGVNYSDY